MNDSVFNTLLSVALVCSSHFTSASAVAGPFPPLDAKYENGFEACTVLARALSAEQSRRAKKAAAEQQQHDKDRVTNAIAALQGKKFTPEDPPKPVLWNNSPYNIIPAGGLILPR